jgi:hypothetical protein
MNRPVRRNATTGGIQHQHGAAQEVSPNVFSSRKRIVALGAAALLAVTVLGTVALAADPTPTPVPGTATAQKTNYRDVFLAKLAGALNIDPATLTAALKTADLATIDQAVANGDLAKNPADAMKQRIEQNGPGAFGFFGFGGPGRGGMGRGERAPLVVDPAIVEKAVADKLGLSVADLETQLKSGKTLADLATAKSLTAQDLYTTAGNAAKPQLDQAVKDGKLTQAQADQELQQIQQGTYPLGGPKGAAKGGPMDGMMGGKGWR